jgi:hypothetical protein
MATKSLDETVALNVQAAMDLADENLLSMEKSTGITRSKFRRRLSGKCSWGTTELAIIAAHFGIEPAALFAPIESEAA